MITQVTLSNGEYGLALLAAFAIGLACAFLIWMIRQQILQRRRWEIEEHKREIENLRAEIKAEVEKALGVGDEDELDPDDFQDDDDNSLGYQPGR